MKAFRTSVAICAVVSCAWAVITFAHGGEDHSSPSATAAVADATASGMISMAKESQFALGVLTARVSERTMVQTRRVSGRVIPAANARAEVYAPQSGRIVSQRAWRIGDPVSKGQTLFSVEQSLTGTERLGLERDLIEADRELEEASRDHTRKKSLEGVVAKKEIEFARIRLDGAKERQAAIKQALTRGTKPVAVTAPIAGTISRADVVGGEYVEVSKQLLEIVNTSTVWIEAQFFEGDLAAMPKGTGAIITSGSAVGTYTGSLVAVGNVIDPTSRTAPVIFAVQNRGEQLKINASADIQISMGTDAKVVAVPKEALVQSGSKTYVVVHRGPEDFEPVEFVPGGGSDASHVQAVSGLMTTDKVVVAGLAHFRSDLPQ